MKKLLLSVLTVLAITPSAYAIDWYVGLSGGNSEFDSSGEFADAASYDDADTSFSLTWGMPVEKFFNLEFAYSDFGKIDYELRQAPVDLVTHNPTSYSVSAMFNHEVNQELTLFGRGGFENWDVSVKNPANLPAPSLETTTGTSPFFGIGLDYQITDLIHMTAEVQQHDFDLGNNELKFKNYQFGLRYFY